MARPSEIFTELVTTTLRDHGTDIADAVSANNALYSYLKKKGNIKRLDGGYEIARPIEYAENQTFQRYSGYETLNVQASDVLTTVHYPWSQAAVHITSSGYEIRANSGKNQMIDLVKARIENAKHTAANYMSVDLYSDGALANQMGGLAHLVQTNGLGNVGGINATDWPVWRNKFLECPTAPSNTTIQGHMNSLYTTLVRGSSDKPNLIVSSHDFWNFYVDQLQSRQRYASSDEGDSGFQTVKYMGVDVVFDSNSNFTTTAEKMYFLNTKYLHMIVHRDCNWDVGEQQTSVGQDAVAIPMLFQGAIICTNRALQGVLIDAT
jgi:hypothetical protein